MHMTGPMARGDDFPLSADYAVAFE